MKVFDAGKTRVIRLPYSEKNYDNMLSRFHLILERYGQTDGRTDRIAISISCVSVLTRDSVLTRVKKESCRRVGLQCRRLTATLSQSDVHKPISSVSLLSPLV